MSLTLQGVVVGAITNGISLGGTTAEDLGAFGVFVSVRDALGTINTGSGPGAGTGAFVFGGFWELFSIEGLVLAPTFSEG